VKSKAAIGSHPIHPALVTIPIGAFALTLIGDITHAVTHDAFWYHFAFYCMAIGVVTALVAAVFGFVDFFGVKMSAQGYKTAKVHMTINLAGVVLYAANVLMRRGDAALGTRRWPMVFGLEIVTFAALGVSGWLGGKMAFENKVGVSERADPEATKIGLAERA
jgi:uncharacterized membrane protein